MPSAPSAFDLSPSDVARQLGVHEDTVKRWAGSGKLRALRTPGGWWRFSQDDVDAFVDAKTQHGGEIEPEPKAG